MINNKDLPGTNSETFKIRFTEDWFQKSETGIYNTHKLLILEIPHKKWYKQLLQFISFGLYEAPIQYKVIQIK
jgi:hypothetical protein